MGNGFSIDYEEFSVHRRSHGEKNANVLQQWQVLHWIPQGQALHRRECSLFIHNISNVKLVLFAKGQMILTNNWIDHINLQNRDLFTTFLIIYLWWQKWHFSKPFPCIGNTKDWLDLAHEHCIIILIHAQRKRDDDDDDDDMWMCWNTRESPLIKY